MSNKKWVTGFLLGIAGIMVGIAVFNYCVDPYHYFHSTAGDGYYYTRDVVTTNLRVIKYEYLKENANKYDGVILGGSKTGGIDAGYLSQLSGDEYFNLSTQHGNFEDYYYWVKWIIENTEIKKIFLCLSTLEVDNYTEKERNAVDTGFETPAAVKTEKSKFVEKVKYLYRGGVNASFLHLGDKIQNKLDYRIIGNGNDDILWYKSLVDRNNRVEKVVNQNMENQMKTLFSEKHNAMIAIERNVSTMKKIKELCDANSIVLQVVIGNTYIGQAASYESEEYYNYLTEMVNNIEFWDFGFLNEYNLNPYNFFNDGHAYSFVFDRVLNQIYGIEDIKDFGVYVTKDNVEEYLQERRQRYLTLKEEYEATGTIALGQYQDDSFLQIEYDVDSENKDTALMIDGNCYTQEITADVDELIGIYFNTITWNRLLEDEYSLTLSLYTDSGECLGEKQVPVKWLGNNHDFCVLFDERIPLTKGEKYYVQITSNSDIERTSSNCMALRMLVGEYAEPVYINGVPDYTKKIQLKMFGESAE